MSAHKPFLFGRGTALAPVPRKPVPEPWVTAAADAAEALRCRALAAEAALAPMREYWQLRARHAEARVRAAAVRAELINRRKQ